MITLILITKFTCSWFNCIFSLEDRVDIVMGFILSKVVKEKRCYDLF